MIALCSSYLLPSLQDSLHSLGHDFQVVEIRDRIRLCPQARFPRVLKRIVGSLNLLVTVVVAGDLCSHCLHAQFMPFARRYLEVGASELTAPPIYHVTKPVVALESVRTNDVIVVRILEAKDQPSGPINFSRDRLELYAEIQVLDRKSVV